MRGVPWLLFLVLTLSMIGLGGCQQVVPAEKLSLKIGVLPIVDALPLYVAQQKGYFAQESLDVELTAFQSALERDSALQAGQLDGELNDLVSAALLNKEGDRVRVVRLAYRGNAVQAMMNILASPQSQVRSAAELRGKSVAVSKSTVIEYSTDRLLELAGVPSAEVEKTEVTKIPVRMEMLTKGQIEAATLPEPFASLAVKQGARVILNDSQNGVGQSVITFRKELATEKPEAVKRLLRAYERAVEVINASPDQYKSLMVEKAKVPDPVRDSLTVPPFPKSQVPTRAEAEAVVSWMVEKGLLPKPLSYEQLVKADLLPAGQ